MYFVDASTKLYYGKDALDYLDTLSQDPVFIVSDPYMVQSGIIKTVTDHLDAHQIPYTIFSDVEPDPSIDTVTNGLQKYFSAKPEVMIALGGGSAIDTAKAILYFYLKYNGALVDKRHLHRPHFIAIPTTSGTGSEVTTYSVVTDREQNVKIALRDREMTPDVALLYAEYTSSLPKATVAYTGMDVLTHGLEAYVTKEANSFTNMYAREAVRKTLRYLPSLYDGTGGYKAQEDMMNASTMAGLAFSDSGLGLAHGLAHTLGAHFHFPHGKINSIVLPYVVAFNAGLGRYPRNPEILSRYARMVRLIALAESSNEEMMVQILVDTISNLNVMFEIPASLKESGLAQEDFKANLDECIETILLDVCTKANPVDVDAEDVRMLLWDVYEGRNPLKK